MFDLLRELGIKSFSFRAITDNAQVAETVKQCGVDRIDLSGCHVDYDDPASQERVIETYRAAGVKITGIGVVQLKDDEAFNRRYFEFAKRAGCDVVSCSFQPDGYESTLRITERLCDEYGMRAPIHNHGGAHWLGNATILDYLFRNTQPTIGLCLDTAWCLHAGEDPVKWTERFADRLYGIHFKDFVFDRKGKVTDVVIGEGALDLPALLKAFAATPFNGSAVIEYEGEDAVDAIPRCVAAIRRLI